MQKPSQSPNVTRVLPAFAECLEPSLGPLCSVCFLPSPHQCQTSGCSFPQPSSPDTLNEAPRINILRLLVSVHVIAVTFLLRPRSWRRSGNYPSQEGLAEGKGFQRLSTHQQSPFREVWGWKNELCVKGNAGLQFVKAPSLQSYSAETRHSEADEYNLNCPKLLKAISVGTNYLELYTHTHAHRHARTQARMCMHTLIL